ncbi:hypothetical protein Syun_021690 [Stephania yunnanensis]|uniref:Serine/threonine-protein kinase PRP4 homolog n=1 Tax=Stephania yunnanensis TaxID=152371 RepID=A0AAP0NPY7_9MAGN
MDDYGVKKDHPIDREASYDELDFKSYSDGNDQSKLTSREKTRYDSGRERVVEHDRKERGDSRERVRKRERERSSSYSRYSAQDDRIDRHGKERERERKRERSSSYSRYDLQHERYDSCEKERGRERKREHSNSHGRHSVQRVRYDSRENEEGRERKRERSSSYSRHNILEDRNDSRDRDRERGRNREREREKEKEKDRKRESDRERDREKGRRLEGANRDKDWSGVRDGDRDKRRDRNTEREIEKESRDVYKDSRRAKQSEYYRDRTRSKEQGGISSSGNDSSKAPQNKLERDEVDIEDYEERVALKLAEQEEEDIDKIKEESRKRRQAILEKYKQNQLQKQAQQHTEGPDKDEGSVAVDKHMGQPSPKTVVSAAPEGLPTRGGSFDVSIADPSFSVGKSPLTNGNPDFERTHIAGGLGDGSPKSERAADMFSDDIFGESPAGVCKMGKGEGVQIERSGLNDNWDDAEGYYSYRFGELLDGRYEVLAAHGRGVFSTVVRAKDLKAGKGDPEEVAIKIIRNNETMYKAGLDELVILKKLAAADPEDRRHCVRFLSSFKYRNHLCLVFESLHMNLREVLKKFGRNIGLKLTAVRAYAKQLFIALKHLRNCGVLHCDIKPDNMLVNEAKNVLKLCDFGNAMFAGKNEITPYLVSRFYRAPEIILGLAYDHPMDIWSVGCCLYELYSGKVLFPGPSNNDMLRLHMELKGPFPKKMLRKGAFTDQHFDQDLNFHATEEDPVTKKAMKRLLINIKPKDIGNLITGSPGEDPKMLANFKDLLEKIFVLDPEKRMTVSQALSHPFITGK